MLTLLPRRSDDFPWEAPHAAPEDRAVGLELELIELVRRREEIGTAGHPEEARLDAEIAQVLVELSEVSAEIAA